MSYSRILVHIVWATKRRDPIINQELRPILLDHIRDYAKVKDIYILQINCQVDHVHCLLSLHDDQNIRKVVQLIKGESTHWINQNRLILGRFSWQESYFAVSVSESALGIVTAYIMNQDKHHRKKTFQDEYQEFMRNYQFDSWSPE